MTIDLQSPPTLAIGLFAQIATGLLWCALGLVIIAIFQDKPLAVIALPLPPWFQGLVGLGLAAAAAGASYLSFRFSSQSKATRDTMASYARLDLSGLNPVWISLAAAVGEEMLFRAALQPLLGIWMASLIFLVAHTRAYRFRSFNRATLVQAGGVFGTSIFLGLVFQYVGLLAAMLVHAALDIVGLYTIRVVMRNADQERILPTAETCR
ncbi:MAG: type II CAAX prenyl endopeptidase Rce1 family protein [Massilia sp.]